MQLYRLTSRYLDSNADLHEANAILAFDPEGKDGPKPPKDAVPVSEEDVAKMKKVLADKKGQVLADFVDPRIDLENVEGKALSELVPASKK